MIHTQSCSFIIESKSAHEAKQLSQSGMYHCKVYDLIVIVLIIFIMICIMPD